MFYYSAIRISIVVTWLHTSEPARQITQQIIQQIMLSQLELLWFDHLNRSRRGIVSLLNRKSINYGYVLQRVWNFEQPFLVIATCIKIWTTVFNYLMRLFGFRFDKNLFPYLYGTLAVTLARNYIKFWWRLKREVPPLPGRDMEGKISSKRRLAFRTI